MLRFSERHGYKPLDIIIKGQIPKPVLNSIINSIEGLRRYLFPNQDDIEKPVWVYYLNEVESKFSEECSCRGAILPFLVSDKHQWYDKLDLIEFVISQIKSSHYKGVFIEKLNSEFSRHNFAYRIVGENILELTSNEEIEAIEDAIVNENSGIRAHLKTALEKLSAAHQEPDYRNSIKESISAVGVLCREITGANSLGDALNGLEKKGIKIQPQLKSAFDKLYAYSNDKKTGIRHELTADDYVPYSDEAVFMLVICSAFINYLTKKRCELTKEF